MLTQEEANHVMSPQYMDTRSSNMKITPFLGRVDRSSNQIAQAKLQVLSLVSGGGEYQTTTEG